MRVTLRGERQLRDLARDLRRAKGTLRREMAQALRRPTEQGVRKAKRAIEELNIRGQRKGGERFTAPTAGGHIRRRIARVIESSVSTSAEHPHATIVVRNDRLGNARNVPWHLDTGKVFRHPIMGNREAWAASRGAPWFYASIDREQYEKAVDEGLDRVVAQIEKG